MVYKYRKKRRRSGSYRYGKKPKSYKAYYSRKRRKLFGSRLLAHRGGFIRP